MLFEEFTLPGFVLDAVAQLGWEQATSIQQLVLPPALEGRDILGSAPTGTGKSAAFVLPIIARLAQTPRRGVQCVILEPTRELAVQLKEVVQDLLQSQDEALASGEGEIVEEITVGTIIGGEDRAKQREHLPTVVCATPGRLQEFLSKDWLDTRTVEILVIDEADRMLDMGFRDDIAAITRKLKYRFQTMLFSATLEGYGVRDFAQNVLNRPVELRGTSFMPASVFATPLAAQGDSAAAAVANNVNAAGAGAIDGAAGGAMDGLEGAEATESTEAGYGDAESEGSVSGGLDLAQLRLEKLPEQLQGRAYYAANEQQKAKILLHLLTTTQGKAIVFVRTKDNLAKLSGFCKSQGMSFASLKGESSQLERKAALRRFRDGEVRLLLATDVASRGLDIDDVEFVYNYDLPSRGEIYVHRAGRTARAGAKGVVISFVQSDELASLERIERYTERPIERRAIKGLCADFAEIGRHGASEKKRSRAKAHGGFDRKTSRDEERKPHKKVRLRDKKNKGKPDFAAKRAKKAALLSNADASNASDNASEVK